MAPPSRPAAAFFFGYLLIQVTVAALQLAKPDPSQFGWQMYSELQSTPRLEVVTADSAYAVDVDSVLINRRADVRYDEPLLEWLCRSSDAERVRMRREVPYRDRTLDCGR